MSGHGRDDALGRRLVERIEDLARDLLGEPNRALSSRRELRCGSKGSLSITLTGRKRGNWCDHEAGRGGGPLQLIHYYRRHAEWADTFARGFLGIDDRGAPPQPRTPAPPPEPHDPTADGRATAIWRVYRTPAGEKARIEHAGQAQPAKLGRGPVRGGAVRLSDPGPVAAVAEGIETGLAILQARPDLFVLAALSASGVHGLVLPDGVAEVVPCADAERRARLPSWPPPAASTPPGSGCASPGRRPSARTTTSPISSRMRGWRRFAPSSMGRRNGGRLTPRRSPPRSARGC